MSHKRPYLVPQSKSCTDTPQRLRRLHAIQPGTHCLADRELDLYETPASATEALLRALWRRGYEGLPTLNRISAEQ
jgi:hypothetical protein